MEPGQTLKIDIKFILKNTRDFFRWLFKDISSYDRWLNTNNQKRISHSRINKKREKGIEWQRRVGLESVLKHIEEIKKYD